MRDHHHYLFFSDNVTKEKIVLPPSETKHAVKALRLKSGDRLSVTDGRGTVYTCICEEIERSGLIGSIESSRSAKRNRCQIQLFVGIPERDSFELTLVNCTALGVSVITPLIADFSQENWWKNSWEKHIERFGNKMVSAMKQSLYPFIPDLNKPISLQTALAMPGETVLVADPEGKSIGEIPNPQNVSKVNCFVGPPGGFSQKELALFNSSGASLVKLTEYSRLRTELAAITLCAQVIGFTLGH